VSQAQQPQNSQTSEITTSLTLTEAAAYLGVSGETVRLWIRDGHLPAKRVGLRGTYRIRRDDLDGMVRAA
jgi:excisionase family DNA binding protein